MKWRASEKRTALPLPQLQLEIKKGDRKNEEHGILEMQRPFPNLQQGTTMLFSIIKASGKVIFVSGDRYGYVELMCMSFMSVAFILWQQQVF